MKNQKKGLLRRVSIPPGSILFYGLLILCGEPNRTMTVLASAAFHEGGHLVMARLFGIRVERLVILPLGADIRLNGQNLSYQREGWIAFGGPLFNFLTFLLLAATGRHMSLLGVSNLLLAFFNLLPVDSLDGGRMLHAFLSLHNAADAADRIGGIVGGIIIFLLYLLSVFLLLKVNGSPLLLLMTCFLFYQHYVRKN